MWGRRCKPFFGLEDYGSATSKAVCNFNFASHCQGACLIFSQLAGAALSKLGHFLLHLEGSCRGKKRAGCGEVHVAERMMLVEGSELGWKEGRRSQGMRAKQGKEKKGLFLVCAGVGGPEIKAERTQNSESDRSCQVLALQLCDLGQFTKHLKPTYSFLHCSTYCVCFLLTLGSNIALNTPCQTQPNRKKADLEGRRSGLTFHPCALSAF